MLFHNFFYIEFLGFLMIAVILMLNQLSVQNLSYLRSAEVIRAELLLSILEL